MMLLALLLAAQAAAAPATTDAPIIVTGTPIETTRRALDDCIARRCPTEQDIAATLAHAENLFVSGDYREARRVLRKSIGRNEDEARALPVPVSNLWRANARVAAHLGEGEDYRRSTYRTWNVLEEGEVPAWRRLDARMEVARMITRLQGRAAGIRAYRDLADEAERVGRADVAGIARLKALWIDYSASPSTTLERRIREIAADASAGNRTPRLGALFLLARIERDRGERAGAAADALIAELAAARFERPTLLYEPSLPSLRGDKWGHNATLGIPVRRVTEQLPTDNFDDRWADVGFFVQPDGRVSEVEVLRESGETPWLKPILKTIEGRIYSQAPSGEGHYRVERYTYTSLWRDRIDTRLRVRSQDARIERLDLTAEPPRDGL